MAVTQTQDEYFIRAIDAVHINPSIMEGEVLQTSLLGPDAAVVINRYAPIFLQQPYLTGDFRIPSTLTCHPGVIEASPQAALHYQWKADGVDIPDEINRTLLTRIDFNEVTITCEVTAVNFLGVATAETVGIVPGIIEPVVIPEYDVYVVTGLPQEAQQNLIKINPLIITGMWVDTRLDVITDTAYAVTGIPQDQTTTVFETYAYGIWIPQHVGDLAIVNPSGDTGDTSGWTITQGSLAVKTGSTTHPLGTSAYFFEPNTVNDGNDTLMEQVVSLDAALHPDIDGDLIYTSLEFAAWSGSQDSAGVVLDFLSASDQVISSSDPLTSSFFQGWSFYQLEDFLKIPALTRKIKVRVIFDVNPFSAQANDSAISHIIASFFKDVSPHQ